MNRPHRRRISSVALLTLAMLLLGASLPASFARAGDAAVAPPAARTTAQPATVVGAIAAIGCGLGIRYWALVVAGGVGTIAAEIGLCTLMLVDAYASHDA